MTLTRVALLASVLAGSAQAVVLDVPDSSAPWLGFMNVFELPSNGGGYVFGSGWGRNDLVTTFDDSSHKLTLAPNTIGDPSPFWYIGGGGPGHPGNKIMDANLYIETTGTLNGQSVTFQGTVLANTFVSGYSTVAFIKDFAADYSSSVSVAVALTPGAFSITLNTNPDPARHVQYGFETQGACVWITDVAPFGNAMITTVPTPSTAVAGILTLGATLARRRRR